MLTDTTTSFYNATSKLTFRIFVFAIWYIIQFIIGCAILWYTYYHVIGFFIDRVINPLEGQKDNYIVAILIIVLSILIVSLPTVLAFYLMQPVFRIKRNRQEGDGIEVSRSECPNLFAMIDNLTKEIGTSFPKHVYINEQVNASVFYDVAFWNIFIPVKKNLIVGVPLLYSLTEDELRAILAHEFGHFSQRSMKFGSMVRASCEIMSYMVETPSYLAKTIHTWFEASKAFGLYGLVLFVILLVLVYIIDYSQKLNQWMYRWVCKADAGLSREMEFDADRISCSIVGTNIFVSAICKVDATSDNYKAYLRIANSLIDNGYVFDNLFNHYDEVLEKLPSNCRTIISTSEMLSEQIKNNDIPYGIIVESLYDSHPSLTQRINAVKNSNILSESQQSPRPALSLIHASLIQRLSDEVQPKTDSENHILQVIDQDSFNQWIDKEISQNYYDNKHIALFSASWFTFNIDDESLPVIEKSPINEEQRNFLYDYIATESDFRSFKNIDGDTFENYNVIYKGEQLTYKNYGLQLKKLETKYHDLSKKMIEEEKMVYSFMFNHPDSDKEIIKAQWSRLFYCIYVNRYVLDKLEDSRIAIHYTLSNMGQPSEEREGLIQLELQTYLQTLQASIKEMNIEAIGMVANENFINLLKWIVNEADRHYELNNGEYLKQMVIDVPDYLREVHNRLQYGEELQLYRMLKAID